MIKQEDMDIFPKSVSNLKRSGRVVEMSLNTKTCPLCHGEFEVMVGKRQEILFLCEKCGASFVLP